MENITLSQTKKLRELKKKYAYDLAEAKGSPLVSGLSDKELLDTLITLELNNAITGSVEDLMGDYIDSHVMSEREILILLSSLMTSLSSSCANQLLEEGHTDDADIINADLLYRYKDANEDAKMVVFAKGTVYVYSADELGGLSDDDLLAELGEPLDGEDSEDDLDEDLDDSLDDETVKIPETK